MDDFEFTEEEIQEQLRQLGYTNVSVDKLREFKQDLENLVRHERSKNTSGWSTVSESGLSTDDQSVLKPRPDLITTNGGFHHINTDQTNFAEPPRTGKPFAPAPRATTAFLPGTSGVSRVQMPAPVEAREEGEEEEGDTTLNTTGSTERRVMKRKVLRKVDGKSQVFDESSVTESDFTDDVSEVEERLRTMPASLTERPKTAPSGERRRIYGIPAPERPHTACSRQTPDYGVPGDYDGPKALIKPMTCHPHMRHVQRTDVVSRGELYRQSWASQRAPGEKQHKSLRWGVKEQMLYHDTVVEKKQNRVFIPNRYKIPSDKKRKNLRWQVRQDLAQGVVPPSIFE